jgi:DNA-directed RNA polymerase sigma subunit (sigma70/sigma32)
MPAQKRSTELAICLQTLTTRERLMLIHRYVLNIAHLLEEVVRTLGVHRDRGGQLEPRGRQKIRHSNLQNFNSLRLSQPSLVFPERETERKD